MATSMETTALLDAKRDAVAAGLGFAAGGPMPRWPLLMKLEISNVCNLRCAMCDTFSALNPSRSRRLGEVERGFLDVSAAMDPLAPLLRHALAVRCSGLGEPTVHPRFREVIAWLSRYRVMVEFFTNGMLVDDELAGFLVAAGVHKVRFSLSGASRDDYEAVYLGGDFHKVLAGIRGLARAKAAAGSPYPVIGVNSLAFRHHAAALDDFVGLMAAHGVEDIILQPLEEHAAIPAMAGHGGMDPAAAERAAALARELGVTLTVLPGCDAGARGGAGRPVPLGEFRSLARSAAGRSAAGRSAAGKAAAGRSGADPLPRLDPARGDADYLRLALDLEPARDATVCLMPFEEIYVRRGGDVKPCCHADKQGVPLGSITRQDGGEIWRGHGFSAMREAILAGLVPNAVCRACRTPKTGSALPGIIHVYNAWHQARHGTAPLSADAAVAGPDAAGAARPNRFEGGAGVNRRAKLDAARSALSRPDEAAFLRVEGNFDWVGRRHAEGWAWIPQCPGHRLRCSVWLGERLLAEGTAGNHRADLEAAGKGDGRYAYFLSFSAPLPEDCDLSAVRIHVEAAGRTAARFSPSLVEAASG